MNFMKEKNFLMCIVFCFCFCLCLIFTSSQLGFASEKEMNVQVKNGQVRETPSFLGKIVKTLAYGDKVWAIEESNGWTKINVSNNAGPSISGWIHTSSLTKDKIALKSGKSVESGTTSDEIALAGKGFDKQIEGEFKRKNPNLNFKLVDKMESIVISEQQIESFIKEGKLNVK